MDDPTRSYIIGETAYHHEGDLDFLLGLVEGISAVPLDAVKFHLLLDPSSYATRSNPILAKLEEWRFSPEQWDAVIERATGLGLDVILLCNDVDSVDHAIKNAARVRAIEVHATGINDVFLLERAASFPGRIILGVSGSSIDEVSKAVSYLGEKGASDIFLMHGFQNYPTDYRDINLSKMERLQDLFGLPVGYADHTGYDDPNMLLTSASGAAMGVHVLEKHVTSQPGVERIDYHAAVGYDTISEIRRLMDLFITVRGNGSIELVENELVYGNTGPMKKAIVARRPIAKGEVISRDMLWFKRTGIETPMRQVMIDSLIGRKAACDIAQESPMDFSMIEYTFETRDLSSMTGGITDDEEPDGEE